MGVLRKKLKLMEQASAYLELLKTVADLIKELGEVPSGVLYAQLCGHMTLEQYNVVIAKIKSTGLVTERGHLLKWIG